MLKAPVLFKKTSWTLKVSLNTWRATASECLGDFHLEFFGGVVVHTALHAFSRTARPRPVVAA